MKFVLTVLSLCVMAAGGYLMMQPFYEKDVLARTVVSFRTEVSQETRSTQQTAELIPNIDSCWKLGPVPGAILGKVQYFLTQRSMVDKTEIADRYQPESFLVYLGPLDSTVSALALAKQFKQQGFATAKPILNGQWSYGVEIARFDSEKEASEYVQSGKNFGVQGVRIVTRLGAPSDQVDLLVRGTQESEVSALFKMLKALSSEVRLDRCEAITQ